MKPYERIKAALDEMGAKLKRGKKHLVYELPNGKTFVMPGSPSDSRRGELNAMTDLKAAAGVDVRGERRKAPAEVRQERRRRPGRAGEPPLTFVSGPGTSMAQALSGVVEQQLRARVAELEAEKAALSEWHELMAASYRIRIEELESLWFVRLWLWLRSFG